MTTRWLLALAALALAALVPAGTAAANPGDPGRARAATAKYHRLAVAQRDGYGLLTDAAGIACIDNPGVGGMGVHYVKGALVGDAAVKATTPEALVYEPQGNGRMRLVALEYVVFQDAWDAAHDSPPSLFGREFMLTPAGNRYGLPAFYELHAWVWTHNPRGMFDDWNPLVSCHPGRGAGSGSHVRLR
jgi:hypothetical protein